MNVPGRGCGMCVRLEGREEQVVFKGTAHDWLAQSGVDVAMGRLMGEGLVYRDAVEMARVSWGKLSWAVLDYWASSLEQGEPPEAPEGEWLAEVNTKQSNSVHLNDLWCRTHISPSLALLMCFSFSLDFSFTFTGHLVIMCQELCWTLSWYKTPAQKIKSNWLWWVTALLLFSLLRFSY